MADEKARESGGEITGTSSSFLANELVDNSAKEYALRELCQELIKSTLDGIQESASYSITVATDQGQGTTNVYGHRQGSSKSSFQLQMTSMGASAYLEKHKVIELLKELTSLIVYSQPAEPLSFMIDELQKKKQS